MVGIVVVSHSRLLARAAVALAEEMLQGRHVPIVVAAGLDDDTFGTDAVQIHDALLLADRGEAGRPDTPRGRAAANAPQEVSDSPEANAPQGDRNVGRDRDGVVVLMDLGSAVLSAELALELLTDDDVRQRVLLCPAPLVEGLVAAVVAAVSGAGRAQVAAEAVNSLAGKQSQLSADVTPPTEPNSAPPAEPDSAPPTGPESAVCATIDQHTVPGQRTTVGRFTISTTHGLHARPAARLVQLLHGLDARTEVRNLTTGSSWVPAASLSRLATLGARSGHQVEVRASGPQARDAVDQLLALAGRNFDEVPAQNVQPAPAEPGSAGPFPASPGIGLGPARPIEGRDFLQEFAARSDDVTKPAHENPTAIAYSDVPSPGMPTPDVPTPNIPAPDVPNPSIPAPDVPRPGMDDPVDIERRLHAAIAAVHDQLSDLRVRVADETDQATAAIFDAHLALLDDPDLRLGAASRIEAGQSANDAWASAVIAAVAEVEALADPYLRARAADLRAVGNQVLAHLVGNAQGRDQRSGVLVGADLTPAQAATLEPGRVSAVVLASSSPTAHSAILIRARGIPAVVGAGPGVLQIAEGTPLAVDGTTGELVIDPPEAVLATFRTRALKQAEQGQRALARAAAPATTRDGVKVLVGANVGSVEDAATAPGFGADLIGLVRTEFLFLGRARPPDLAEQESVYRSLAEAGAGRRITLRTLDVGGDKPLDYLPRPAEANPFLGVRGIRLALARPRLLADQLLAIVRTAHDFPVSVMFPMVSTLDEVFQVRRFVDEAIKLAGRGEPAGFRVGMMVEVPAAALKAAAFAAHVDFLSIGTNDLTQYALAAERGNDAVAGLGDPLDPGVLRLIDATCRGAGERASVAVCGELAADPQATSLLVGLGVRELSVVPRAVPGVKHAVRDVRVPQAAALAGRALAAPSAGAVRDLLATI